jgi:hypothetical protein
MSEAEKVNVKPVARPPVREDNPRSAAKKRAEAIRGHLGGLDEGSDEFFIDMSIIPDGWTYEWKRHTTAGATDPSYEVALLRVGWEPVPVSRHPEMMPAGSKEATIMRKGMILMERPTEIVDERRRIEQKMARDQVRAKEAQLAGTPEGTMTRDHAKVRPQVKKSYEPMPVPEE